jgi:hypothetical protein
MTLFTPEDRESLRDALVAAARADERIVAAAHIGSFATGRVDRWSDVDLGLGLADGAELARVVDDWTDGMYAVHGAVAHVDMRAGAALYRVFLLASTLQVDLSFWPAGTLAPMGEAFRLAFGEAGAPCPAPIPTPGDLVGMAWLHALHVRSAVARGRPRQAELMLQGMRDQVLALVCVRHGLSPHDARGMDDLPPVLATPLRDALPRSLDAAELRRAFALVTAALLREAELVDAELARRLEGPVRALVV